MKRYKIAISAIALIALSVGAYAAEVDKEVEVTRAYVPEIKPAVKLHLTPDSSDDDYITPDIDYTITPISIETKYDTELYSPIKVNLEEFEAQKRYYTKLGVGAPLQSVVDIYATPIKSRQGYLMGYFNQDGRYAKIENNFGEDLRSTQNQMRGGVAAGRLFEDRTLDARLNYDYGRWSRYAMEDAAYANPIYQSVNAKARFGDNLTDLSHLNFVVDGSAEYFWSKYGYESISFGGAAALYKAMLGGEVEMGLSYDMVQGSDHYDTQQIQAKLSYDYDGEFWGVKVGAAYYNDRVYKENSGYVTPDAEIFYHLNRDRIIAYAKSSGDILRRDFASLSAINPYLQEGLCGAKSEVVYDNRLGLKGTTTNGAFGYNLYVGYEAKVNHLYWALLESSTQCEFVASHSTQSNFNANLDLEYMPVSNLIIGTTLSVADYTNKKSQQYRDGEPSVEFSFTTKYSLERWRFGLSADLLSPRDCSVIYIDPTLGDSIKTVKIPTAFDLGLSIDYSIKPSTVIFAQAQNLLNDEIYEWVGFKEYGINAMVGVKMQF